MTTSNGRVVPHHLEHIPEAIVARYATQVPNSPIVLHSGPIHLTGSTAALSGDGEICFSWLPSPGITVRVEHGDYSTACGMLRDRDELMLNAPSWGVAGKVSLTTVHGWLDGARSRTESTASPNVSLSRGDISRCCRLMFHVLNSQLGVGDLVRHVPDGNKISMGRRVTVSDGSVRITVDSVPNSSELRSELDRTGGFAITHVGIAEKLDGSSFNEEAFRELRFVLHLLLSFLRGAWSNVLLWSGTDASGEEAFVDAYSPWGAGWNGQAKSWFAQGPEVSDVDRLFKGLARRIRDPEWREGVDRAIHWYCECNGRDDREGAIALIQTSLELLAWLRLVENTNALSSGGFDGLPAADKIRLLLRESRVSTDIPPAFTELAGLAKSQNWIDGPGAFTAIRNSIVHPTKKNRDRLAQATFLAKYQAQQLGLWYLEMVLLHLFEYEGWYSSRVEPKLRDKMQFVPWSKPS